ncbi:transcription factor IIIA-like isoform X2 [Uloborus diversus]|uniref:transcription factor IIIA-like isoform X2 n=1 Tax=Uloborus diversus TaxID=327109 RepID=UPI0024099D33|nr:transcription factor IIIA-like isoform X2 [Uloborus diversus]
MMEKYEFLRPFVCLYDDCFKSYTRRSHLKRHEDTHETSFCCKFKGCEAILKSKETLRKHVDIIHRRKKAKTYECTICDASFNKHSWLQKHTYRHTGIKPYLCPVENCNKRFLVPNKLRKHMTVHNGYTCTETDCKRNFSTWSLYVKHFKVYHPVVHKCGTCDKVFSTAPNLRSHEVLHNNEREVFICPKPYCTRFYFAKRNLNFHIKSYHDKRPFTCTNELCQKSFPTEALLSSHQRDHDPNKPMRKKRKKKQNFAAYLAGCAKKKVKSSCSKEEEQDNINLDMSEESNHANQTDVESQSDNYMESSEEIEKKLDESEPSENSEKVLIVFNYKSVLENAFDDADSELEAVHSCSEDSIVREN